MKHKLFIIAFVICSFIEAKARVNVTDYYMGRGRIVISSDGNKHDKDDWVATPMSFMILAKAGVQKNFPLYVYCDHVWESQEGYVEVMNRVVSGSMQRFGFNDTEVIVAVEEPERAYAAMAEQIAKSTRKDPLFIIAAGPMEVIGNALEIANKINPQSLQYVTIVSHSASNNNHSDNPRTTGYNNNDDIMHSGWVWRELKAAFVTVNYVDIVDQNKDRFNAPWDSWEWLKESSDPNINWVYSQGRGLLEEGDFSDACI